MALAQAPPPGRAGGPPACATAEVGIVKFDRPPPPAHPASQSGSGQAGSDCARPGKTGLRVAEGPGQRLRVSGDLNLRVPGLLPKSRRAQATPLASSRSAGLGPPAGSLPFFGPESDFSILMSPGPGPRGTECLFVFCCDSINDAAGRGLCVNSVPRQMSGAHAPRSVIPHMSRPGCEPARCVHRAASGSRRPGVTNATTRTQIRARVGCRARTHALAGGVQMGRRGFLFAALRAASSLPGTRPHFLEADGRSACV